MQLISDAGGHSFARNPSRECVSRSQRRSSGRTTSAIVLLTICLSAGPIANAQSLPPRVRADLLEQNIAQSIATGKREEALKLIGEYRKLGVTVPPALILLEARLTAIGKEFGRSQAALREFLAIPNINADPNYPTALALFREIENHLQTRCDRSQSLADQVISVRRSGTSFRDCPFAPEMVIVAGGAFMMGSDRVGPSAQGRNGAIYVPANESPKHRVSVRPFAVGKFEVTFEEWDACVADGGCNKYRPESEWGRGRQPVVRVNWSDASAYVSWLSRVTRRPYRLLSEAEWEFATRGSSQGSFTFGSSLSQAQANIASKAPKPVGSYAPNSFGLFDVHGNVLEWTQDCWNSTYEGAPADGTAWNLGDCESHVARGGSWASLSSSDARITTRYQVDTYQRADGIGFRVARPL
jgi:formylglycine-generating enzyme required for sulfatase activity